MKLLVLLLAACGHFGDPATFPARICGDGVETETCGPDNMSPMRAGVACQAMANDMWGCTEWDGHHRVSFQLAGVEVTISDLGAKWGQFGAWHQIGNDQISWCEDRCSD